MNSNSSCTSSADPWGIGGNEVPAISTVRIYLGEEAGGMGSQDTQKETLALRFWWGMLQSFQSELKHKFSYVHLRHFYQANHQGSCYTLNKQGKLSCLRGYNIMPPARTQTEFIIVGANIRSPKGNVISDMAVLFNSIAFPLRSLYSESPWERPQLEVFLLKRALVHTDRHTLPSLPGFVLTPTSLQVPES